MFESDRKNLLILIIIGVVVRFWGIGYGLPSVYNSTEYFVAKLALSFGARHSLEPVNFVYPTFYLYVIAALYGAFFVVGRMLGVFGGTTDFALRFLTDPTAFYLLGRSFNALLLIGASVIFYLTLRQILKPVFSLLLTLVFVFSYNISFFGFWMVPDAMLILGTVAVFYYIVKAYFKSLTGLEIILVSLACGLTISTKYNAGFLALGWLLAVGLQNRSGWPKYISFAVSGIFAGFLAGTPYWLLSFSKYFSGFRMIWSQSRYAYNLESGLPYLWEIKTMLTSELLLGLLLVVFLFLLVFQWNRFSIPITVVVLPTFLVVGSWEKKGLDYILIIFPALLIYLAYRLQPLLKLHNWQKWAVGGLLMTLLLNVPRVFYQDLLHTRKDTRQLAGEWVMQHLPPGSRICYDHYHYDIGLIDIDRFTEYGEGSSMVPAPVKAKLQKLRRSPENYRFVFPLQELAASQLPDSLLHVASTDPYLWQSITHPHKSIDELMADSVKVLILNSDTYLKYLNNPPPGLYNPLRGEFLKRRSFYKKVFERFEPAATFEASFARPGPIVKIYPLKKK